MKIYLIKPKGLQEMLTASEEVAKYCKEFYKEANRECEIIKYEVKTKGKNYNDIAMPKPIQL